MALGTASFSGVTERTTVLVPLIAWLLRATLSHVAGSSRSAGAAAGAQLLPATHGGGLGCSPRQVAALVGRATAQCAAQLGNLRSGQYSRIAEVTAACERLLQVRCILVGPCEL